MDGPTSSTRLVSWTYISATPSFSRLARDAYIMRCLLYEPWTCRSLTTFNNSP